MFDNLSEWFERSRMQIEYVASLSEQMKTANLNFLT